MSVLTPMYIWKYIFPSIFNFGGIWKNEIFIFKAFYNYKKAKCWNKRKRPLKPVFIVRRSGSCGHSVNNITVIRTSKVYITTTYQFLLFSNHCERWARYAQTVKQHHIAITV